MISAIEGYEDSAAITSTIFKHYLTPPDESIILFGPRGTGKPTLLQHHFPSALFIDLLESGRYLAQEWGPPHGPAAYLAKQYQVATVALVSPYLRFDTLVSEMPLFGYLTPFLKYTFPTIEHLKETTRTRIIIVHGSTDVTVPYSHTERLQAALDGSHKPLVLRFEGSGHNDVLPVAIEPLIGAMLESRNAGKKMTIQQVFLAEDATFASVLPFSRVN